MKTIKDIAEMADVSIATVSHVVNGTRYVSPELVKRVNDIINSLDETPNFVKRKNRRKKTNLKHILLFAPNYEDAFSKEILTELYNRYHSESIMITTINYEHQNDLSKKVDYAYSVFEKNIFGQIFIIDDTELPDLGYHAKYIPTLFINKNDSLTSSPNVMTADHHDGVLKATDHLIKQGHKVIAYIDRNNDPNIISSSLQGYLDSITSHHMNSNIYQITNSMIHEEILDKTFQKIIFSKMKPSAVIINTELLLPFLAFLDRNELTYPDDISIVATHKVPWLNQLALPITSIDYHIDTIVNQVDQFFSKELDDFNLRLETDLLVNASTKGIGRGPFGEKAASINSLSLTNSEKDIIASKRRTAVISFHYTGASWMTLHEKGIRDIFNQLNIDIIGITDAHFDAELQNKQLESLLSFDPDIFIAIPTDNEKTGEMFQKIAKSKTKLILITNVPTGLTPDDYISVVSVNEHHHGRLVAKGLGDFMRAEEKNNVGFFTHDSNFYATTQRDASAKQMLIEEFPELNIVREVSFKNENDIYKHAIDLMINHPEINGIYVPWDGPAKQVLKALIKLNRDDVIVSTADLDYSLAISMAGGKNIKSISAQQPYEQGRAIGMVAANAILNNDVPSYIGIDPISINRDNLLEIWETIYKEIPPTELEDLYH